MAYTNKTFLGIALILGITLYAQKTQNRNLQTPFSETEYISGSFSSIINKTNDSFQIVKDSKSGKFALLFEKNDMITNQLNHEKYDATKPNSNETVNIIFESKEDLLKLYDEIQNSIKKNIEKNTIKIAENEITLDYTKIPLLPGTLSVVIKKDGKLVSSFGMGKSKWQNLFAEVR